MSILIVEYPKAQERKPKESRTDADLATERRMCPLCSRQAVIDLHAEIKTMYPPLYVFRCGCGHSFQSGVRTLID